MSSVQSFIRQIPLATTYYTVSSGSTAALYTFVPTAANSFPGNYPNGVGYVQSPVTFTSTGGNYLRDMGKTIKCQVGAPVAGGAEYFFREVQVLTSGVTQNGLTTFGVSGSTASPSVQGYLTYYVPVSVGGSDLPSGLAGFYLTPIAGGQM
jgi:hypothetical protein